MSRPDESGKDSTLLEAMLRLHGDYRKALVPLHLTPLQAGVLLYLSRNPRHGVFDIAHALSMRPPTLTPVIHGLVLKKYVRLDDNSHDRRARPLRLTTKGEGLVLRIVNRTQHLTP